MKRHLVVGFALALAAGSAACGDVAFDIDGDSELAAQDSQALSADGDSFQRCGADATTFEMVDVGTEAVPRYDAVVRDPAAVAWFVAQSETTFEAETEYIPGRPVRHVVQRRFPPEMRVEQVDGQPALTVSGLRPQSNGSWFATGGPSGVQLSSDGRGLRMLVRGSYMPGSRALIRYEVGEWAFDACSGPTWRPEDYDAASFFGDDLVNGDVPYAPVAQYPANNCELFVDSFAFAARGAGFGGFGSSGFEVQLATAEDLNVVAAGMYAGTSTSVFGPGDEPIVSNPVRHDVFPFSRRDGNVFTGRIDTRFLRTDGTRGQRSLRAFAFFADVRGADGDVRRVWLTRGASDFTPADYDRAAYFWSDAVFDSGTRTTREYVWRDSGSPLFWAREACL